MTPGAPLSVCKCDCHVSYVSVGERMSPLFQVMLGLGHRERKDVVSVLQKVQEVPAMPLFPVPVSMKL